MSAGLKVSLAVVDELLTVVTVANVGFAVSAGFGITPVVADELLAVVPAITVGVAAFAGLEVSLAVDDELLAIITAATVELAATEIDGASVLIAVIALESVRVEYRSKFNVTLVCPPIGGRCLQAASKAYRSFWESDFL